MPGVWTEDVAPVPPASALRRAPPRARVSSRGRACGAGGVSAPRLPSRPLFEGLPSESRVSAGGARWRGRHPSGRHRHTALRARRALRGSTGGSCLPPPLSPQSHVWLSPAGLVEVRAEQRGRGRVSVDRAGLPSLVSLLAEPPAPQLPAAGREATGSALWGLGRRIARTHVGCFLACGAVDAGRARMEVAAPAPAPGPVRAAEGPRPVPPSPGAARSPRVPAGHAPEPLRVPGGPA